MKWFYCKNLNLSSSHLRGRPLENVKNISYHSLKWQSHFSFNNALPVYIWWPLFPIYIDVQSKYTNNDSISNVQTSDYALTMAVIMASYRFNSSRPIEVHTRTRTRFSTLTQAYYHYYISWCSRVFKKSPLVPFIRRYTYTSHCDILFILSIRIYAYPYGLFFFVHDTIIL